ncbi:hypothetical protein [Marinicellulosiphila megalodicopiae]|uniref:hypothetical protein n=1 Tax=Marinicellulosiphila megalodicopiae TaxID=2724896 RepID=UPI003BB0C37E
MIKLPYFSSIKKDEMLSDYLWRLSERNGFKNVDDLLEILDLKSESFNRKFCWYESIVFGLKENAGIVVKIKCFDISNMLFRDLSNNFMVCKSCYKNDPYIRYFWRNKSYYKCHFHDEEMDDLFSGREIIRFTNNKIWLFPDVNLKYEELCKVLIAFPEIEDSYYKIIEYRVYKCNLITFYFFNLNKNGILEGVGDFDVVEKFVDDNDFEKFSLLSLEKLFFDRMKLDFDIRYECYRKKIIFRFRNMMVYFYEMLREFTKFNGDERLFLNEWGDGVSNKEEDIYESISKIPDMELDLYEKDTIKVQFKSGREKLNN